MAPSVKTRRILPKDKRPSSGTCFHTGRRQSTLSDADEEPLFGILYAAIKRALTRSNRGTSPASRKSYFIYEGRTDGLVGMG